MKKNYTSVASGAITAITLTRQPSVQTNENLLGIKIKEIMNNDKIPIADRVSQGYKLYCNHYHPKPLTIKKNKSYLILPYLSFTINADGTKEIQIGWLTEILSFKF